MGATGGLCTFDYTTFVQKVIPAFRAGETHPIIQHVISLRNHHRRYPCIFQNLAEVVSYCDEYMTTCTLDKTFYISEQGLRLPNTPHHQSQVQWEYEDFTSLFEWVVTNQVITHYTLISTRYNWLEGLFDKQLTLDDTTRILIHYLDERCIYWSPGGGGYGEGIRGWLDPEETELLAMGLPELPTLPVEPDRNSEFWQQTIEHHGGEDYRYQELIEYMLRIQSAVQQAIQMGHGVLWGRDLSIFYGFERLFDESEQSPIRL